ncbi:hypothetical protein DY000_02032530 [Brassica cretica]|uniref:Uncharacterized protein n=1 Tax=Brassica cretica TaxID=69181 RepID=A0ABQ7DVH0_BRACR|nr:hypothetical protein DY000_02032530 [Brassica cretica]
MYARFCAAIVCLGVFQPMVTMHSLIKLKSQEQKLALPEPTLIKISNLLSLFAIADAALLFASSELTYTISMFQVDSAKHGPVSHTTTDYLASDCNQIQKTLLSKKLFKSTLIISLRHMDFLLIINKYDLLENKGQRVPMTRCKWFEDNMGREVGCKEFGITYVGRH